MDQGLTNGEAKRRVLHELFDRPGPARVAGVSDGLSALLAERAGFDALWASGLGICASKGLPDAGVLGMREFLAATQVMDEASRLPVIADCDTGFGDANAVARMVSAYERAGIAAVCIEDKIFPKRNSFRGGQRLADAHYFGAMLKTAKSAQRSAEMVLIARVEALVVGTSMEEALRRACLYERCGADAILIHSKAETADEVLEFARQWRPRGGRVPLLVVPTTYESITEADLAEAGISVVIYANQALRAAQRAMEELLGAIHAGGSSRGLGETIASVDELCDLIGMAGVERMDSRFERTVDELKDGSAGGAPR